MVPTLGITLGGKNWACEIDVKALWPVPVGFTEIRSLIVSRKPLEVQSFDANWQQDALGGFECNFSNATLPQNRKRDVSVKLAARLPDNDGILGCVWDLNVEGDLTILCLGQDIDYNAIDIVKSWSSSIVQIRANMFDLFDNSNRQNVNLSYILLAATYLQN